MNIQRYLITVRQTHIALVLFGIFLGFSFNVLFEVHTFWILNNIKPQSREWPPNTTDNSFPANQLFNDVKVLCWVMTCPNFHRQKAVHIRRTWGKRCNKLLFMSTVKGLIALIDK